MGHPVAVTDQDFETQVLKATMPVLVDFWAEWCVPCKAMVPMVEDLATEYDGKVNFVKMNVAANPETSVKFGIRGIPTLLLFKNGKPVDQVGAVPKAVLKKRLEDALK